MKPICVPCQRFFRPKKNGFAFIEAYPKDGHTPPGTAMPSEWKPYKLWEGDLWECQGCGAEIVVGAGRLPIAEHYQENFQKAVDAFAPQLQVNDC
jgi:hypothetical protein